MNKLSLCLLLALAFAGCNKPAEEADPTPVPATPRKTTPTATPPTALNTKPASPDWMWKTSKGKNRDVDPLKIKDDPLEKPTKK